MALYSEGTPLATAECSTADQLLAFLERFRDGGFDLSTINVYGNDTDFSKVRLEVETLSDGSKVHNLRLQP